MSNSKLKVLETYQRTVMTPFDTDGASIAFTFKHEVSNSTEINISWRLVFAVIFTALYICSSIYFCVFEATSFMEYSDAFFPIVTMTVALCSCKLQIIVRPKVIELIKNVEMVIEDRKSIE